MQPAAVRALEVEEERELLGGVRRAQDGDFPVRERRKRRLRPAGVIRCRRQRPRLDEGEDRRARQPGEEPAVPAARGFRVKPGMRGGGKPTFRSAFRQAQGPASKQDPTRQQESQQVQEGAVLAEGVEDEELEVGEPEGGADEGAGEDEQLGPEDAVQGAVLFRFSAKKQDAEREQEVGHGGGQADGDAPEHIGPGAPNHAVAPAACAAAHHPRAGQGMEKHPSGERQAGGAQQQRHGLEPSERHASSGSRRPA